MALNMTVIVIHIIIVCISLLLVVVVVIGYNIFTVPTCFHIFAPIKKHRLYQMNKMFSHIEK